MGQESSDPLPYVQVDRAVIPRVALLAQSLGVTMQHALGSLVQWWNLCGDPRELESILERTPDGKEPEVVLNAEEISTRFLLASGKTLDPAILVHLGMLERRPDAMFRVRGMSRFFKPLVRRKVNKAAGAAGGKASVESRAKKYGSTQPQSRSSASEATVEANASAPVEQLVEPPGITAESKTNTADSDQRSAVTDTEKQAPSPPKRRKHPIVDVVAAPSGPTGDKFFDWSQGERTSKTGLVAERAPEGGTDSWFQGALIAVANDEERLRVGFRNFLGDDYWRRRNFPWAGWLSQWERYVPPAGPPPAPPLEPLVIELLRRMTEACGSYPASQVFQSLSLVEWDQGDAENDPTKCRIDVFFADPYFVDWCRDHYHRVEALGVRFHAAKPEAA
ncbi:MAG: hypothetical protein QM817_10240 [Archangium sp.]